MEIVRNGDLNIKSVNVFSLEATMQRVISGQLYRIQGINKDLELFYLAFFHRALVQEINFAYNNGRQFDSSRRNI